MKKSINSLFVLFVSISQLSAATVDGPGDSTFSVVRTTTDMQIKNESVIIEDSCKRFWTIQNGTEQITKESKTESTDTTKHEIGYLFVEDDPKIATLDSLIGEEYFLSSCFESDPSILNIGNFEKDIVPAYSNKEYKKRLDKLNSQTPFALDYNSTVQKFIELYANKRRDQVSRMLGLSELYFPMVSELMDKHNLPFELKYLSIVESALNPTANSRAGAKGLWQFMYATGKIYGLKVTSYMDDRFDPYKSTVAACEYLGFLYGIYDNWELALAAYNSGPGRVNRAIRRSGGKRNYWELWRYLPRETRGYVPAFIAVNYIMNYASEHNIYPTAPKYLGYEVDTVVIRKRVFLEDVSKVLDIPMEDLTYLNPVYKIGMIPGIEGESYVLTLPCNKLGDFMNNESSIYNYRQLIPKDGTKEESEQLATKPVIKETLVFHKVRSGEVLGLIAERYKCSLSDIREWNNLSGSRIYVGQRLTIHASTNNLNQTASKKVTSPTKKISGTVYHTIKSGDTLWDIAKLYDGVTISQIRRLNNINNDKRLKPGMKIKVSTSS